MIVVRSATGANARLAVAFSLPLDGSLASHEGLGLADFNPVGIRTLGNLCVLRPGFETPGWAYSGGQL
jgi:hypothetical protein